MSPGGINTRGEFFDPEGELLQCDNDELSPAQALAAIRKGARVVHEACGCGGSPDCQTRWLDRTERHTLMKTEQIDFDTGICQVK